MPKDHNQYDQKNQQLLEVEDLKIFFKVKEGWVQAVDGVSFALDEGGSLGLVGESGCGKTTTAYAITQLLPRNAFAKGGEIRFKGENLLKNLKKDGTIDIFNKQIRKIRWSQISIIFQGAMDALNPVYRVGRQIREAIMIHNPTVVFGEITSRMETKDGAFIAYIPWEEFKERELSFEDIVTAAKTSSKTDEWTFNLTLKGFEILLSSGLGEEGCLSEIGDFANLFAELKGTLQHQAKCTVSTTTQSVGTKEQFALFLSITSAQAPLIDSLISRTEAALSGFPIDIEYNLAFEVGFSQPPIDPVQAYSSHPIRKYTSKDAQQRIIQLFKIVGLGRDRITNYPHEYSGGMKQRALIAMALALNPSLVIADEPTTALDVVTQYKILNEIRKIQGRYNMAMILISHDISQVAEFSERIAVMYAGRIAEIAPTVSLFRESRHPYTIGLLNSIPTILGEKETLKSRLRSIPGSPPPLVNPPTGCRFHPRCSYAKDICSEEDPEATVVGTDHVVWCHKTKVESEGREW